MTQEEAGQELSQAWSKYEGLFGELPHGTVRQMNVLISLCPSLYDVILNSELAERVLLRGSCGFCLRSENEQCAKCPECGSVLDDQLGCRVVAADGANLDTEWIDRGPTGEPRCPECRNSLQNCTPYGSPNLLRCATCKNVWRPRRRAKKD